MALTRIAVVAIIALWVAGCHKSATSPPPATPSQASDGSETSSSAPAVVAAAAHNYQTRDGNLYCYQTAISQDALNAGQAASDVLCFRYLGEHDSVYRFSPEQTPGVIVSCATPCETIKFTVAGEIVKRVTFEPNSVIGGAFEDAMNGQLKAADLKHHRGGRPHQRRHSCHPDPEDSTMEFCEGDG